MAARRPFAAIHRHGFVRVAAATPTASSGDVAFNVQAAIGLAERAHERGCDLVVFPELNISSYAVDDLHLQEEVLEVVKELDAERDCPPAPVVGAGEARAQQP